MPHIHISHVQYVDEAKPLVSKRQPKQRKEEPTQGDMFAASKPSTQHENPDYKKETEKEGGSVVGDGGGKDLATPTSQSAEPQVPQEISDPVSVCVCCLLYTSPSPRDATLSRMPSSA